jgi:hypothetical protein
VGDDGKCPPPLCFLFETHSVVADLS